MYLKPISWENSPQDPLAKQLNHQICHTYQLTSKRMEYILKELDVEWATRVERGEKNELIDRDNSIVILGMGGGKRIYSRDRWWLKNTI